MNDFTVQLISSSRNVIDCDKFLAYAKNKIESDLDRYYVIDSCDIEELIVLYFIEEKGIEMDDDIYVVGASTNLEGQYILSISENGYCKMSLIEDYRKTLRGSKGVTTMNTTEKVGMLAAMKAVNGDEDILITTDKGIVIRTSLTTVARSGRNTQGVRIIRLDKDQRVASIAIVDPEDEEENISEEVNVEVVENTSETTENNE